MIQWREPLWLFTLVMVPSALVLIAVATRARMRAARAFARGERTGMPSGWLARILLIPPALGLIAVALADPHWGRDTEDVERTGVDIVFVLDLSRSMLAEDTPPTRLERAKREIRGLLELLGDDRIALVTFAGRAELACPLTDDQQVFLHILEYAGTDSIPAGGSRLAQAFELAVEAFDARSVGKAVVVLTDGEYQGTDPSTVLQPLTQANIPLYVIGLGTRGGAKIPVEGPDGSRYFMKDSRGNDVVTRLNTQHLASLAERTSGAFLATQDTAFPMDEMYSKRIRFLTAAAYASASVQQTPTRYQIPLFIALVLLCVLWFPRRVFSRGVPAAARATAVVMILVTTCGLLMGADAAPPSSADAKKVDTTELKRRERAAQRHPGDPRYLYNWGTRLHQAGDQKKATVVLEDARKAASASPRKPEFHRDTAYNLGNSQFRLAEGSKKPQAKREALEAARDAYAEALRVDPADAQARHNLALTLRQLDELPPKGGGQSQQSPKNPDDSKQQDEDSKQNDSSQNEANQSQQSPNPAEQPAEDEPEDLAGQQEAEQALDRAEAMQREIDQYKARRRRQGSSQDW